MCVTDELPTVIRCHPAGKTGYRRGPIRNQRRRVRRWRKSVDAHPPVNVQGARMAETLYGSANAGCYRGQRLVLEEVMEKTNQSRPNVR